MKSINFSNFEYENPLRRVWDFNLIKTFICNKTNVDFKNIKMLELGAGEGWFSIIGMSHGWICNGVDINENLESINKYGYVEKKDVREICLTSKHDLVHSNVFQYMTNEEIKVFFDKNIKNINMIFITMSTDCKNNKNDSFRINFTDDSFFDKLANEYNLHHEVLVKNLKRVLCKKEVLNFGT